MGKMKELQKLGASVASAAQFAQQIKAKVTNDLQTLRTLEETIGENRDFLANLDKQVKDATSTLVKLQELLE